MNGYGSNIWEQPMQMANMIPFKHTNLYFLKSQPPRSVQEVESPYQYIFS